MKVGGPGPVSGTSKAKGAKVSSDGSFSTFLDAAGETKEASGAGGISKLAAVNFVNMVEPDGKGRRKQLMDDADEILDELMKIRDALLIGNISVSQLQNMHAKILKMEADCDDPALNDIIEEVKTRAAVELAKLGF